jgi:hypothetical protein
MKGIIDIERNLISPLKLEDYNIMDERDNRY